MTDHDPNKKDALLPCPHCGSEADYAEATDVVDGQEFRLYIAGCPMHCANKWQGDPDSATMAWNTRTPDPRTVKVTEELTRAIGLAKMLSGDLANFGG